MVKEDIRRYIWIEFVIWLLILFFIICGVRIYNYKIAKKLVTYQIFISDADGLIVGSPVRYMGVPVGYINKIKIVSDEVYLKIVITQKDFKFPKGVIATVEFNGMGGSKSLEIYPPTEESLLSGKIIAVQNPRRLSDATSLLADMFGKINSITSRMSYFAREVGVVDFKNGVDTKGIEDNMDTADILINKVINEELKYEERKSNK
ncbi:MCE family protein [bacterium]|nr:MCE family protein [bacterium]